MIKFYFRDVINMTSSSEIYGILKSSTLDIMFCSKQDPKTHNSFTRYALGIPVNSAISVGFLYNFKFRTYSLLEDIEFQEVEKSLIRKSWEF